MRRHLLATLGLLVFTGVLAAPASSLAGPAGDDSFTCTFSGRTSSLTDIPGIMASETQANGDAVDDALSAMAGNQAGETGVVVEAGNYSFGTSPPFSGVPTECVHHDVDGALGLDPDRRNDTGPAAASMTANGSYSNLLCGTGTTTGTVTISLGDAEVVSITAGYTIEFAAGDGAAEVAGGTMSSRSGNANPTRTTAGAGTVHIEGVPATPGATGCGNSDAVDFNVLGSVTFTATSGGIGGPTGAPVNVVPPVVVGVPAVGQQPLQTTDGVWTGSPWFGYVWQRCDQLGANCVPTGGTSSTYTLTTDDVGHTIRSVVTANNGIGSGSQPSPPTAPVQGATPLPPESSPPTGYPSRACLTSGTPLAPTGVLNDGIRVSTYLWQESANKVSVCERVHAGSVNAGGRLEVDTTTSGGVTPTWTLDSVDMSPCTTTVVDVGPPANVAVKVTAGTPASVCVIAGSTKQRVTVGTTGGSPVVPQVCWTPDPDTPGSRQCNR